MAATGTVSTGPSVRPVSTVTRTFSPFSAAGSGLDGLTVSGTKRRAPPEPELPDPPPEPTNRGPAVRAADPELAEAAPPVHIHAVHRRYASPFPGR